MSGASVLPLAITMMAGPQIMSAIVLVTGKTDPVRTSAMFVAAVAAAVTIETFIWKKLGDQVSLSDEASNPSTAAEIVQIALIGILLLAAVKAYLGRETSEPPKWMGKLQAVNPGQAFRMGFLLILLMPSDVVVMMTVGTYLSSHDLSFVSAIPFLALTVLIAALPLLFYVAFRKRAVRTMPKLRDWMNVNSWLVNIIVYAIFIVLIAFS